MTPAVRRCFLLLLMTLAVRFAGADPPRVFVVNSYDPETFLWTAEILRGLDIAFDEADLGEVRTMRTLDAYANPSEDRLTDIAAGILAEIRSERPDVVVCTDDDALRLVGMELTDVPVVFNGINAIDDYLGTDRIGSLFYPGANVTGVYQTIYFDESVDLLRQLRPRARTFAALADETTTGNALLRDLEQRAPSLSLDLVDRVNSSRLADWSAALERWSGTVDAVFVLSANRLYDGDRQMSEEEAHEWLFDNSDLPEMACWAYQIEGGLLVSATDDGENQGYYAGIKAVQILQGQTPGRISITAPPSGVPAVNVRRARRLGLTIPPNLLMQFRRNGEVFGE